MEIFIDTSAFYALADRSDAFHSRARKYFDEACLDFQFFTSEYVLVEAWSLLNAKLGKAIADQFWDWLLSGMVCLIGVDSEDLRDGRAISRRFMDQSFSLVDCVSFQIMARHLINIAFAFDHHFGTVRVGGKRFQVVP